MSIVSDRLRVLNLAFGKKTIPSKHAASKKNHKHIHNFSRGELKDAGKYPLGRFGVLNSLPKSKRNEIDNKFAKLETKKDDPFLMFADNYLKNIPNGAK